MLNDDENAKIPFRPLLGKWLNTGKTKADFARKMGVTQAVITNWIARGTIPEGKLRKAAALVGMKPDDYLIEIGVLQPPRPQKEPVSPEITQPLVDFKKSVQEARDAIEALTERLRQQEEREAAKARQEALSRRREGQKKHGGLK